MSLPIQTEPKSAEEENPLLRDARLSSKKTKTHSKQPYDNSSDDDEDDSLFYEILTEDCLLLDYEMLRSEFIPSDPDFNANYLSDITNSGATTPSNSCLPSNTWLFDENIDWITPTKEKNEQSVSSSSVRDNLQYNDTTIDDSSAFHKPRSTKRRKASSYARSVLMKWLTEHQGT